jgi:hypothetical protein
VLRQRSREYTFQVGISRVSSFGGVREHLPPSGSGVALLYKIGGDGTREKRKNPSLQPVGKAEQPEIHPHKKGATLNIIFHATPKCIVMFRCLGS